MDRTNMKEFKDSQGKLFKKLLKPGETMKLPNGAGSVTFGKDIKEWAGFQVVQQPGSGWALAGALAAIGGLAASLFIQRRRVWVRAVKGADGVTVVEMAGLGRSESAKVPEELGHLAGDLYEQAPGAPGPDTPADSPDPAQEPGTETPVPAEGAEK
jgi:cytochrome c biogenesis protein